MVDKSQSQNSKDKPSHKGLDKLLCTRLNEDRDGRDRCTSANKIANDYLETMESTCKKAVGSAETRHRQRPCKSNSILRQQILLGGYQNMCGQSNLQRKTSPSRTSQSVQLLRRTAHVEVDLNRRMPNGTYGGVKGWRKSTLFDYAWTSETIPHRGYFKIRACIVGIGASFVRDTRCKNGSILYTGLDRKGCKSAEAERTEI